MIQQMSPDYTENADERKDKLPPGIQCAPRGVLSLKCDSRPAMENRLALLKKLEASLARSHRALISLDLPAIEQSTKEQRMLSVHLSLEMRRPAVAGGVSKTKHPELSCELTNRGWKVLHAAQLQAALLKRAHRKLHVMANMLAGSDRNYAAPLAPNNGLRICASPQRSRTDPCQV